MRPYLYLKNVLVGIAVSASLYPAFSQTTITFNIQQPNSPLLIDAGSNQQITEGNSLSLGGNPIASVGLFAIPETFDAASNQIFNSENELRLQRKEIVNLFNLQLGEKFSLSLIDDNNKVIQLAGSIVNHESKGVDSGVLNIQLSNGSTNYKLLITRNLSPQKNIEYSIILIDKLKDEWYKLTEETQNEFVLSLTDRKKIIME
jgi:hypothetical protein